MLLSAFKPFCSIQAPMAWMNSRDDMGRVGSVPAISAMVMSQIRSSSSSM